MADEKARALYRKGDLVGLFQYLGPMWLKVCMETLEDLITIGFLPNPERYKREVAAAGVAIERMELAMAAALSKSAKQTNWESFRSANDFRFQKLPPQQQEEVKAFWLAGPAPGLTGSERIAHPATPTATVKMDPAAEFAAGFIEGIVEGTDPTLAGKIKATVAARPVDFYASYINGLFTGFLEGAKSLIETLAAISKLAVDLSPPGITYHAIRAAVKAALSKEYRDEIANDIKAARKKIEIVADVMVEFVKNRDVYIANSKKSGKAIGVVLAKEVGDSLAKKDVFELGNLVGEIVGRIFFEIVVIVLTEGIGAAVKGASISGGAMRGAAAAGEATSTAARVAARVADKLRDSLEGLPALRRFVVKLIGESPETVRLMALWGERGAQTRIPPILPGKEATKARAGGKLWREGVEQVEEFISYSGGPKVGDPPLPKSDLTQPPRHILKPDPIPEGAFNKGIPDHLKHLSKEEQAAWLKGPEGTKWRNSQQLPEPLNNIEEFKPHTGPRDHDAEAKMFEDLLKKTTKDTKGEFHFKVDRPVCPACKDMIFRFSGERPGIKVIQHSLDRTITAN